MKSHRSHHSKLLTPRPAVTITTLAVLLLATVAVGLTIKPKSHAATTLGPVTAWHYTANGNFSGSTYVPGSVGFNLPDISTAGELSLVPTGDKALVYVDQCNGADATFINTLTPFKNQPKVYGFYLMDEPDPTGQYKPICTPANLKAESDWIHANIPGTKSLIIMMNFGSESNPTYAGEYTPLNSGLDVIALDPYPCRTELSGCDYTMITKAVAAAEAAGVPLSAIAPVYQTFGGGNYPDDGGGFYLLPTAAQETQILNTWASVVPNPPMDYAYSWGAQNGDTAMQQSPALQQIFAAHNAGTSASPTPTASPSGTGDLNGDGQVNIFDLSILLSAWGTTNATSDLNHDGTVNIFDLSTLLSHWGS